MKEDFVRHAKAARYHLSKVDLVLAPVVSRIGLRPLERRRGGFGLLAETILGQQLSGSAARAITSRVRRLIGGKPLSAELVRSLSDGQLRSAGVSVAKIGYLRDLAEKTLSGELSFRRLPRLSDDEIVEEMTRVRGVGPWTAHMYLMFVLARPDVFAPDDLGIRSTIVELYGLKGKPDAARLSKIAENWRPYRTTACLYLWAWRGRQKKQ